MSVVPASVLASRPAGNHSAIKGQGLPSVLLQSDIHMTNDRMLFDALDDGPPLYEICTVSQYDHRTKAYRSGRGRSAVWGKPPFRSAFR